VLAHGSLYCLVNQPATNAMTNPHEITAHYSTNDLLTRLNASLVDDGADPAHPSIDALAPYDQFHGRGMEATIEVADSFRFTSSDRILDIGSGIGGPARYFAQRFGCRVSGIDLTPEFCEVARHLTALLGLTDRVAFQVADALALPFADASFDGAYSMNVSMNIADKDTFYREIQRVLKPDAPVVLSEIAKGAGAPLDYPTPWASSARTSFLATPEETRHGLEQAGFEILKWRSTAEEARMFGVRSRAAVERGEKPPHRAVFLIHREMAPAAMSNTARGVAEGRIVPIEVLARKKV